jgi:SagB-type dehydrogenase family enzyme
MSTKCNIAVTILGLLVSCVICPGQQIAGNDSMTVSIALPAPDTESGMPLNDALSKRRSRRNLAPGPLSLPQISQILWAAQGITAKGRFRTAPSAGALYPIEIYVVAENVQGMDSGLYHYSPQNHSLSLLEKGSWSGKVAKAALGQGALTKASAIVLVTAEIERTSGKYGDRADRYIAEETGAIAQNIYLQVESLGLSTVLIGAFYDERIQATLGIQEVPYAIMPIGRRVE